MVKGKRIQIGRQYLVPLNKSRDTPLRRKEGVVR